MARTVAIGKQDFGRLIEDNCFYVDKTDFIREWWENKDDVTLITRPRRFGKTLTMSMVDYFFSIRHEGRGDLFEGLSIWGEEKYRKLQGTYPVISLSFAGVKDSGFTSAYKRIAQELADVYRHYDFLLDSKKLTDNDKIFFAKVDDDISIETASITLKRLSRFLFQHYGKRPVILLDEYDTPMQEAWLGGYWDELAEFMRSFFNATFKTNPYMERAIMTGITRVSKESVFSDLNNLKVITTTSKKYEAVFGFTEKEVSTALDEYGIRDKMHDVKRWYDGFRFGDCDNIYNPWSVINFLDEGRLMPYWANTSSNKLVSRLIRGGSVAVKEAAEDLLQGKAFEAEINEEIVFSDLDDNERSVWSLLLASGYLKAAKASLNSGGKLDCELTLTNLEVKTAFEDMFAGWFTFGGNDIHSFSEALEAGDKDYMNSYLNAVMKESLSFYDTGKELSKSETHENFYHGFVLGLIAGLRERYQITSNRESGLGRYDVMMRPKNKNGMSFIFEFKVLKSEKDTLQNAASEALRQIIGKGYAACLKAEQIAEDRIYVYGFAFSGKQVLIDGGCILNYVLDS